MELNGNGGTFLTIGIILMAAAIALAVAATVIFYVTGKRLKARLEEEYGKKRR